MAKFFDIKKLSEILLQSPSDNATTILFALNVYILAVFRKFKIGRKIVKNRGLTPLLFGEIFQPKNYVKYHRKVPQIRPELSYLRRDAVELGLCSQSDTAVQLR